MCCVPIELLLMGGRIHLPFISMNSKTATACRHVKTLQFLLFNNFINICGTTI